MLRKCQMPENAKKNKGIMMMMIQQESSFVAEKCPE